MKRSLIRSLTALVMTILLMLAVAPAASAAPWGLAVESGFRGAGWFESARQWLQGLLGTAGALALRFAVFHAGKASSRDPRATFLQQRGGA